MAKRKRKKRAGRGVAEYVRSSLLVSMLDYPQRVVAEGVDCVVCRSCIPAGQWAAVAPRGGLVCSSTCIHHVVGEMAGLKHRAWGWSCDVLGAAGMGVAS